MDAPAPYVIFHKRHRSKLGGKMHIFRIIRTDDSFVFIDDEGHESPIHKAMIGSVLATNERPRQAVHYATAAQFEQEIIRRSKKAEEDAIRVNNRVKLHKLDRGYELRNHQHGYQILTLSAMDAAELLFNLKDELARTKLGRDCVDHVAANRRRGK